MSPKHLLQHSTSNITMYGIDEETGTVAEKWNFELGYVHSAGD